MPPIGHTSDGPIPTLVWPDGSPVVYTAPQPVPQWPHPQSSRIDGRLRWLSDDLVRPIASRYLALLKYENDSGTEFRSQWFWFDLQWIGPGTVFLGETGQNGDISATFEIGFVDVLPNAGVPGTYLLITLHINGTPDGTQYTEVPLTTNSWPYNVDWNWLVGKVTIPSTWPYGHPFPWTVRWCDWYPLSECCPAYLFEEENEEDTVQGALMYKNATPTVNVNTTATIFFENELYDTDGFIDIGTDNTKVVVPPGFNWLKINAGVELSPSTTACSAFLIKNGGLFSGFAAQGQSSGGSFSGQLSLATGWLPVVAGDYFQLRAAGTGRTTGPNGQATFLACEGRGLP